MIVGQALIREVAQVRKDLTEFFDKMCKQYGTHEVLLDLMRARNYGSQEMYDTLKEIGVFRIEGLLEIVAMFPDINIETLKKWGLCNDKGNFILKDRYVVAIRDVSGQVMALVGWHPKGGSRKYVTTPTMGFSRDASFFNGDCYKLAWEKWGGNVFLVEGIFDAVALRSLGLPALAVQGLEMSAIKSQMLTRFNKVIAIPDNDKAGRSVNPFFNAFSGKKESFIWRIENPHVFVILPKGVKDIDFFVREYEVLDDLLLCQSKELLFKLKITA